MNTATARLGLQRNEAALSYGDPAKIEVLAQSAEDTARELARLQGAAPGSDIEKSMVVAARSNVIGTAIEMKLANGENRAALTMYDKAKGQLDQKTNDVLSVKLKAVATDLKADEWIARETPNETRRAVRQFWEAKGYSPEAAAALAGNFGWESGFNPNARNKGDGRDGSDSIGLGQWNGPRAAALQKFAAERGANPADARTQLEFAAWELDSSPDAAGVKDRLKGAKTLEEANDAALGFFRPSGWTAQNAKGSHGYEGRLANARSALADTGVGFDKANIEAVTARALADPGLTPAERTSVVSKIQKNSAVIEGARTAELKGLRDKLEATTFGMIVSPDSYKDGTLAEIAGRLEALGEKSEAASARVLANNERALKDFLSSSDVAQKRILEGLLGGKAKALASGVLAADERGRTESGKLATEIFDTLKTAAGSGVKMTTMQGKAEEAVAAAVRAGDLPKAREIRDFYTSQVGAQDASQQTPMSQTAAIEGLRQRIEAGEQTHENVTLLDAMEKTKAKQDADFARDVFATGRSVYGLPPLPLSDGAGREQQAAQIAKARGLRLDEVPRMTNDEFAEMRSRAGESPLVARQIFQGIAANYPPESIPSIAAGIAGKGQSDPVSRGYAAALSFFADKEPDVAVAILDGVNKRKTMGDALRDMPKSDTFHQAVKDKMGNAFRGIPGGVPAIIVNAAEAIYTSKMVAAGRQGEKALDAELFKSALNAAVGETIVIHDQTLLPPKGVGVYHFSNALGALMPLDLPSGNMRTMNGSPVTAEKIARYGILTNAGKDGLYFVEMLDPARGWAPSYVEDPSNIDPRTGQPNPYILDIKPLLERAKEFPNYAMSPLDAAKAGRRQAPASPTANVDPMARE